MGWFGISVTDFTAFIVSSIYASEIEAKRGDFLAVEADGKKRYCKVPKVPYGCVVVNDEIDISTSMYE